MLTIVNKESSLKIVNEGFSSRIVNKGLLLMFVNDELFINGRFLKNNLFWKEMSRKFIYVVLQEVKELWGI